MASGIQTNAKFIPIAFILFFVKTNIWINGVKHTKPWGINFFELAPGNYTVEIAFNYITGERTGGNMIQVEVKEGQTAHVQYEAPMIITMKGNITAF